VPGIILVVEGNGCIRLTTSLLSESQLSRRCESLDVSQAYGPPQPLTGIAFPFLFKLRTIKTLIM
jgi:hypothetical protein